MAAIRVVGYVVVELKNHVSSLVNGKRRASPTGSRYSTPNGKVNPDLDLMSDSERGEESRQAAFVFIQMRLRQYQTDETGQSQVWLSVPKPRQNKMLDATIE
jgi:hypothetical protein